MNRNRATTCRLCEGTGYKLEEIEEICTNCYGEGRMETKNGFTEQCGACYGRKVCKHRLKTNIECVPCCGSGVVYY